MREERHKVVRKCVWPSTAGHKGVLGSGLGSLTVEPVPLTILFRLPLRPICSASFMHRLFCTILFFVMMITVFCSYFLSSEKIVSSFITSFSYVTWIQEHKGQSELHSLYEEFFFCLNSE